MDEEYNNLCNQINRLSGVDVVDKYYNSDKGKIMIFFECVDFRSLSILARASDARYNDLNISWKITVETTSIQPNNQFMISNVDSYNTSVEMIKDVTTLRKNIRYWSSRLFEDYFKDLSK